MVRVAINGFGRIGRMLLRIGINDPDLEFVAINDLSEKTLKAHLFKYDSVHGKFPGDVKIQDDYLVVDGKKIKLTTEKDPEKLPWKELKVDVVAECTGFFTNKKGAEKHITAGAKKVLISAPAKSTEDSPEKVKTIVYGVNDKTYDKKKDHVLSNASCTTNCLAPMIKVLDESFSVKRGFFVTVHAYTSTQSLVDGANKNLRRARSAAMNIVPTSSGAAIATEEAIPSIKGKVTGYALRIPTPDGSVTDLTVELGKEVTLDELNDAFKKAAAKSLKGILKYTEEEIVSIDIVGDSHSVIYDSKLAIVNGKKSNFVKIVGWYDNEYGFSCRMIDVMKKIGK